MDRASEKPRKPLPASRVFWGIAIVTLAIFAGMTVAYFKLIRYERVAAYHVPESANFAARVDLEKVILYEPIRKHLLPLLNGMTSAEAGLTNAPQSPTRLSRVEKKTGIKLGMDIREVLIATGPGGNDWVVVMGGLFPESGVVRGIYDALIEEGKLSVSLSSDGLGLTFNPSGVSLAQADDGAIVAAASSEQLELALPRQTRYAALGLNPEGAGGFGMSDSFAATLLPADENDANRAQRAFGEAHLASSTEMRVTIELRQATNAAQLETRASAILGMLRERAAALRGTDFGGERALLARAATSVQAPNQVIFSTIWDRDEIDRGAQNLAEWLRRYLRPLSPNSP